MKLIIIIITINSNYINAIYWDANPNKIEIVLGMRE